MKKRMERINVTLRKEISLIIAKDINDPRISFISIVNVDCSSDLKNAKVYFKSQDENKYRMEEILNKASGFISHRLGEKLRLKYIPRLSFHYDKNDIIETVMEEENIG